MYPSNFSQDIKNVLALPPMERVELESFRFEWKNYNAMPDNFARHVSKRIENCKVWPRYRLLPALKTPLSKKIIKFFALTIEGCERTDLIYVSIIPLDYLSSSHLKDSSDTSSSAINYYNLKIRSNMGWEIFPQKKDGDFQHTYIFVYHCPTTCDRAECSPTQLCLSCRCEYSRYTHCLVPPPSNGHFYQKERCDTDSLIKTGDLYNLLKVWFQTKLASGISLSRKEFNEERKNIKLAHFCACLAVSIEKTKTGEISIYSSFQNNCEAFIVSLPDNSDCLLFDNEFLTNDSKFYQFFNQIFKRVSMARSDKLVETFYFPCVILNYRRMPDDEDNQE